jgi:hypothetical protein
VKQESQVVVALGTAALAHGIMTSAIPSLADIRAGEPNNNDIASTMNGSSWMAAGVVGAVALITKSPLVLIAGGGVVLFDFWSAGHANAVNPQNGAASMEGSPQQVDLHAVGEEDTSMADASGF